VRILQRYIFFELTKVFVAAFLVVTLVLTVGGTLRFMEQKHVGFGLLVRALPLITGQVLPYIFPVAVLLATTMVYGRMAADNEIIAVRAAGVHLWHVVAPALLLGVLASSVSLYVVDWYIPRSRVRLRTMLSEHAAELIDRQLASTEMDLGPFSIVHHGQERGRLKQVNVVKYGKGLRVERSIDAEELVYHVDRERGFLIFQFLNGTVTNYDEDARKGPKTANFDEIVISLDMTQVNHGSPSIKDMVTPELWAHSYRLKGEPRREALARAYERGALGLACFVFVFVGVPLGIRMRSGHLLSAFALSCLPVYVVYFPMLIMGQAVAEAGLIPSGPALWAADVVLIVLGGVLMGIEFRR